MVTSLLTSRGQIFTRRMETRFLQTHLSDNPLKVPCSKCFTFLAHSLLRYRLSSSLLYVQNEHFSTWLSSVTIRHFGKDWQSSWQETGSNLQQNALKVAVISTLRVYLQDALDVSYTTPFACLNTQHNGCDVLEVSGN